jgi:hypothetical protein
MTYWSKFELPTLREPLARYVRGARIDVLPSPYDSPELFRTYLDSQKNQWVIEFKYIDEEPLISFRASNALRLRLGRNSGRVYRIEAAPEFLRDFRHRAKFIEQLSTALRKLEEGPKTGRARANYEFVRLGMLDRQNTLFEAGAAS